MSKTSKNEHSLPRVINAYVAVALIVLLVAHAVLGTVGVAAQWRGALEVVIWASLGIIALHILLCICTTYSMFTDTVRPASQKKRQHQILKWVSGGALVCVLVAHLCGAPLDVLAPTWIGGLIAIVLMGALAWHSIVGVKSLTRDLNKSSSLRTPIRIALIVIAVIVSIAMLAAVFFAIA